MEWAWQKGRREARKGNLSVGTLVCSQPAGVESVAGNRRLGGVVC